MKKILISLVVVAMVIALALGACAPAPAPAPAPGPAPTPGPAPAGEIILGNVEAQTGMYSGFGEGDTFGVKAAVDDINALGGIDVGGQKMKVKLVQLNCESDPPKVGSLSEDLITREKINALVFGVTPPPMWSTGAAVAEKYQIPCIIGGGPLEPSMALRSSITPPWQYWWMSGFAIVVPPEQGDDFRSGKPGYTIKDTWLTYLDKFADKTNKVAGVFATDDSDGGAWYSLFPGVLADYGLRVVGAEKKLGLVPMETTDFSSIIKEWKDQNVEILWGNCPGPVFGAMWKQAVGMGFKPKIVQIGRAPLFYVDAISWGPELSAGIGVETWWTPAYGECTGYGGTTPESLFERWTKEKQQPMNPAIGLGYHSVQITLEAIRKAGSLDPGMINAAIGNIDMSTMCHRVKFNADHYSRQPIFFCQWFKTNTPQKLENKVVYSAHDFLPAEAAPIFPKTYD